MDRMAAMTDPEHDRLVREVRSWYRRAYPAMGYKVEEGAFATYRRSSGRREAFLANLEPSQVAEFVREARAHFDGASVRVWLEGREQEAVLGRKLEEAGCDRRSAQTYLAHTGSIPDVPHISGAKLEAVSSDSVYTYVVTKQQAFANAEGALGDEEVDAEVAVRRSELAGEGRFFIARLEQEPAAVIGWYEGEDRFIFQLGTRVPFRNLGIAKYLLCWALEEGYRIGCSSVLINADPEDTPVQLYRRLGFVDEVYWRREYELPGNQTQQATPT